VSVRVQLPPVLRRAVDGERWLQADGTSVAAVLSDLGKRCPSLALHLFDEQGDVRQNIVCVHAGAVVRARDMASHSVQAGDELVLANALAGG
jgi:molybdopterin converting factor small subunit